MRVNYSDNYTAVLFRCIGDLSTLPCSKESPKPDSPWAQTEKGNQICFRNAKETSETLLNSATALDSYVGWIAASWVAYFTRGADPRDTHIVGSR